MKISKKLLCSMLISSLVINNAYSNTTITAQAETISPEEELLSLDETVYVDGMEVSASITADGEVILLGSDENNELTKMVLETDGTATIESTQTDEVYTAEIENLTSEDIDVELYNDENELVEEYDEYDDLIEDSYDGQEVISLTFIAAAVIMTAVVAMSCITVYKGQTYVKAKKFHKIICNEVSETVKNKFFKYYYPAVIINHTTFIVPKGMSKKDASNALCTLGLNIYTFTSSMAKNVITYSGFTPINSGDIGKTHLTHRPEIHKKSKGEYLTGKYVFKHYHVGYKSNGKYQKKGSGHALFGTPVYVSES